MDKQKETLPVSGTILSQRDRKKILSVSLGIPSAKDTVLSRRDEMTKKQMISGALAAVFLISTACWVGIVLKNEKDKAAFEQLRDQVQATASHEKAPSDPPAEIQEDMAGPRVLPQYAKLHEQNPDMAGWIKIEGTNLSYPVMYTPDDVEYYLRKDFYKNDSIAGTPFIGYDCTLDPRSDNLLLYGHNMKSGDTMFTPLLSYQEQSFWREHPVIQFDTLYETGKYDIVAVFHVTADAGNGHFAFYNFTDAENEEEFYTFVDTCKELSLYDTGVTASYGDELITLTTCNFYSENGRFVVVARLKMTNDTASQSNGRATAFCPNPLKHRSAV
ncbi:MULTISPECIES: class B sortase [Anaerotruncus]|uniref:class B sortase n=1 Tax=Anaerotruncus TaxID=244127 RepID=UPI0011C22D07|nr:MULTISPECIES: class B sortase [Anaerotruncus]